MTPDRPPVSIPTILVVDDEPAVRLLVERVLLEAGFRVLSATGGTEALGLLERGTAVDLLLVDLRMPTMSGSQLALKVAQLRPEVRVLIMAAYPSDDPLGWRVIVKPFPPELLEAEIRRALEGPSARDGSGEFPANP